MDKIHAMQLFIRVAELESFSRAADTLGLPKGSVSRQIQALEKAGHSAAAGVFAAVSGHRTGAQQQRSVSRRGPRGL